MIDATPDGLPDAGRFAPRDPYSAKYASHVESATRRRIRHEVYGSEYPQDVDPRSFVTRSQLRRLVRELRVGPGNRIIDLGCGQGGPGLWAARQTGADLLGIDLSDHAIARAARRAAELGLASRARFIVGDIAATGLPDATFDAAMSVDVLWAVPDKAGALCEAARILKPGARFVVTSWDRDRTPPGALAPAVADHRPLLEHAGFVVEHYDVDPAAERLRRIFYERMVAAEETLKREVGQEATTRLMSEAKGNLGLTDGVDYLAHSRRIFVVACRSRP